MHAIVLAFCGLFAAAGAYYVIGPDGPHRSHYNRQFRYNYEHQYLPYGFAFRGLRQFAESEQSEYGFGVRYSGLHEYGFCLNSVWCPYYALTRCPITGKLLFPSPSDTMTKPPEPEEVLDLDARLHIPTRGNIAETLQFPAAYPGIAAADPRIDAADPRIAAADPRIAGTIQFANPLSQL